jgi:predicted permease
MPDLLRTGFGALASMSTPLCMIILGIRLAAMDFRTLFTTPLAWLISAGKLLVFPLFCWALTLPFPLDPVFRGSVLILAATPCASILLNLAEIHHNGQELAANCALLSTLLSVLTIPLLSFLV